MVTGNEYIFDNIDEALKYILKTEQRALSQDPYRQKPPMMMRAYDMKMKPVASLDYPLSAWVNSFTTCGKCFECMYVDNNSANGNLSTARAVRRASGTCGMSFSAGLFGISKKC